MEIEERFRFMFRKFFRETGEVKEALRRIFEVDYVIRQAWMAFYNHLYKGAGWTPAAAEVGEELWCISLGILMDEHAETVAEVG